MNISLGGMDTFQSDSHNAFVIHASVLKYSVVIYDVEVRFTRINRQLEYRVDALVSSRMLHILDEWDFLNNIRHYFTQTIPEQIGRNILDCIDENIAHRLKVRSLMTWNIDQVLEESGVRIDEFNS